MCPFTGSFYQLVLRTSITRFKTKNWLNESSGYFIATWKERVRFHFSLSPAVNTAESAFPASLRRHRVVVHTGYINLAINTGMRSPIFGSKPETTTESETKLQFSLLIFYCEKKWNWMRSTYFVYIERMNERGKKGGQRMVGAWNVWLTANGYRLQSLQLQRSIFVTNDGASRQSVQCDCFVSVSVTGINFFISSAQKITCSRFILAFFEWKWKLNWFKKKRKLMWMSAFAVRHSQL